MSGRAAAAWVCVLISLVAAAFLAEPDSWTRKLTGFGAVVVLGVLWAWIEGTAPARALARRLAPIEAALPRVPPVAALTIGGGLLALVFSWTVIPVSGGMFPGGLASTGELVWHFSAEVLGDRVVADGWSYVCWPVLLAEQGLILVITGGLLTWVVRRERRRRAIGGHGADPHGSPRPTG